MTNTIKKQLFITVGISASGKSTWTEMMKFQLGNVEVISSDSIRKELTGDVSDQSQNRKVWGEAYDRLFAWYIRESTKSCIFDSTMCSEMSLDQLYMKTQQYKNAVVIFVVFESNPFISCLRIRKDLKDNKDRAATPVKIIFKQYKGFRKVRRKLLNMSKYVKSRRSKVDPTIIYI